MVVTIDKGGHQYIRGMRWATLKKLQEAGGAATRRLHDELFSREPPPARLGVRDLDDETLCHHIVSARCGAPGCGHAASSLLESEQHYGARHGYSCSSCKRALPSPHLLDLHLQETHDSFFAVLAAKKPSYSCYIEECKDKFMNPEERLEHCVKIHKLPKDFRFYQKPKIPKSKTDSTMDVDLHTTRTATYNDEGRNKVFTLGNAKQKTFVKSRKKTNLHNNDSTVMSVDEPVWST